MGDSLERAIEEFLTLCDLDEAERERRLDALRSNDGALHAAVSRLLAGDRRAGARFDESRLRLDLGFEPADGLPGGFGPFRVVGFLGSGGMGTVYRAEQDSPRRTVALKVIHAFSSPQLRRRFLREIDVLAQLGHPGIARIYDVGETEGGQHYFTMELVEGRAIVDHALERDMTVAQRLELLARVCDAVAHAHERGIVHRDLKPRNVLVDAQGAPRVLDFGVARLLGQDASADTLRTSTGEVIGTLAYMSPEQAAGGEGLDEHSDVYSLGVLAYELLTGSLPLDVRNLPVPEALRVIVERDPTRPSALRRELGGEVETILLKCLEKDPGRRYASVASLASDVRRWLAHEPIHAKPPTTIYQLRKFARRNRGLVAGLSAATVFLLGGTGVSLWQNVQLSRARTKAAEHAAAAESEAARALKEADSSERILDFVVAMFEERSADRLQGSTLTVKEVLDDQAARLRGELVQDVEVRGRLMSTIGDVYRSLALFEEALPLQEEAATLLRGSLGDEDPWTLDALNKLAVIHHELGNFGRAEALGREVVETSRRLFGDEAPATLEALTSVASSLHRLGRHEESLRVYEAVIALQERHLGEEHASTLTTMNDLALLYDKLGRGADAVRLAERNLELRRRVYGEEHPCVVSALANLAVCASNAGQPEEGARIMEQVLEIQERTLGEEHHRVYTTLDNLGTVLSQLGRGQEAEPLLVRAFAGRRALLGEDHTDTLLSRNNLGSLYFDGARVDEAEALFREAVRLGVARYGPGDPLTALLVSKLWSCLARQGRREDMEALYLEMLDAAGVSPAGFRTLVALADHYEHSARPEEAPAARTQAVYCFGDLSREDRRRVWPTVLVLAARLWETDTLNEAEELYAGALEAAAGDDVQVLDLKQGLARVYAAQGRAEEAGALSREILTQNAFYDPSADERRRALEALVGE